MDNFSYIDRKDTLVDLVKQWLDQSAIAIDTEFMRTDTYYARPGLIQIADSRGVYLIDPLKIDDLEILAPVIESDSVIKVIHAMGEDIDLLRHSLKASPQMFFDTQIAAGLAGFDPSMGYQKLVSVMLGVEVDKSETRSNWLRRPLSDSQLSYAALDVKHLLPLYPKLIERLEQRGRVEAVREECDCLIKRISDEYAHPELLYLKMRFAYEVSDQKQRLLKRLVEWRERKARQENRPKSWVINDKMLLQIARKKPRRGIELNRVQGISIKHIQRYGDEIAAICNREEQDSDFIPVLQPLRGDAHELFKRLRQIAREVAEQESLEAHQLISKRDLERLAYDMANGQRDLPQDYQGWKYSLIGEKFEAVANELR